MWRKSIKKTYLSINVKQKLINEESTNDILIEKNVETDLNLIIDNLEDMYSSVFTQNNVRSRRFVIQKYNTALSKLDTVDSTSSKLVTVRTNITNNDMNNWANTNNIDNITNNNNHNSNNNTSNNNNNRNNNKDK